LTPGAHEISIIADETSGKRTTASVKVNVDGSLPSNDQPGMVGSCSVGQSDAGALGFVAPLVFFALISITRRRARCSLSLDDA
jgi:hypothetical protein